MVCDIASADGSDVSLLHIITDNIRAIQNTIYALLRVKYSFVFKIIFRTIQNAMCSLDNSSATQNNILGDIVS